MPSAPVEALEAALADPSRDRGGLERIAQHPRYFLLMTGHGLPVAPDAQGRRLGAVFTSEEARDAFHAQLRLDAAEQIVFTESSGPDLFPWLRDMHLDGIVFNCSGPGHPIPFAPQMIAQLCAHLQPGGPAKGDFDRLASAAFPDGAAAGPMPALDSLWSELFDLKDWVFALRPQAMGNPYPYMAIFNDQRCVFAFTDSERARQFCIDSHLLDAAGKSSFHMTMPLPGVLQWIAEAGAAGEFEVVHFNFGGVGWFAPYANIGLIREHLNKH